MKTKCQITLTLPDLSPEAAYGLSGLMEDLSHKVDLYYADEIRTLLHRRDREDAEMSEIEQEILTQKELDLNDTIPFDPI